MKGQWNGRNHEDGMFNRHSNWQMRGSNITFATVLHSNAVKKSKDSVSGFQIQKSSQKQQVSMVALSQDSDDSSNVQCTRLAMTIAYANARTLRSQIVEKLRLSLLQDQSTVTSKKSTERSMNLMAKLHTK